MRFLTLFILALLLNSSAAFAACTANDQSSCVFPLVAGVQAGTVPNITCLLNVAVTADFGGLVGNVCYPTGKQATAPILAYFPGSELPITAVWVNKNGTRMTAGLIMGAERGYAMWSLAYVADTAGPLQKWQCVRCALYYLKTNAGTISVPGNPNVVITTGDSQGGFLSMITAQNAGGFADLCDTTPVPLNIYMVVNNDGPSNWGRSDLYAGSTYQFGTNPVAQSILQAILTCSDNTTCTTADAAALWSPVAYMPLGVPLMASGGDISETYIPWAQNGAESIQAYGTKYQGYAQLPGDHLGDTNLTTGKWWPWVMNAVQNTHNYSSGKGYSSAGGY